MNTTGFTSIEAKNYKSFNDLILNLQKNHNPKNMIAIYGENGSGKSNIINLFSSLVKSTRTLDNQRQAAKMLSKYSPRNKQQILAFKRFIHNQSVQECFNNAYMIDAKGPMEITYNFQINGQNGYYKLMFDSHLNLLDEQLHFTIKKAMGRMFHIKRVDNSRKPYAISLNSSVFKSKSLRKSITDSLIKFWGKHTLLSSLTNVFTEINHEFIKKYLSSYFMDVYEYFRKISVRSDLNNGVFFGYLRHKSFNLLNDLEWGIVQDTSNNRKSIKCTEQALNDYFLPLYSDMVSLNYRIINKGNRIQYNLYENKRLSNKIVPIPFQLESNGTKRLLGLFTMILDAINGDTVIIDEIDQGIHDLLMNRLISDINEDIKGQLIFTTHDTYLMTELNRSSLYVIQIDSEGNKRVVPISQATGIHISPNNNVQNMYLHGFFSGVPYLSEVFFNDILRDVSGSKKSGKKRND